MSYTELDLAVVQHAAVLGPANGTAVDLTGMDGALIQFTTGGTAGVVTPEISTDNVEWRAAGAYFQDMAGATVVTTPVGTINTLYKVVIPAGSGGTLFFRPRISTAYVTTGVTINAFRIRP